MCENHISMLDTFVCAVVCDIAQFSGFRFSLRGTQPIVHRLQLVNLIRKENEVQNEVKVI